MSTTRMNVLVNAVDLLECITSVSYTSEQNVKSSNEVFKTIQVTFKSNLVEFASTNGCYMGVYRMKYNTINNASEDSFKDLQYTIQVKDLITWLKNTSKINKYERECIIYLDNKDYITFEMNGSIIKTNNYNYTYPKIDIVMNECEDNLYGNDDFNKDVNDDTCITLNKKYLQDILKSIPGDYVKFRVNKGNKIFAYNYSKYDDSNIKDFRVLMSYYTGD